MFSDPAVALEAGTKPGSTGNWKFTALTPVKYVRVCGFNGPRQSLGIMMTYYDVSLRCYQRSVCSNGTTCCSCRRSIYCIGDPFTHLYILFVSFCKLSLTRPNCYSRPDRSNSGNSITLQSHQLKVQCPIAQCA